VLQNLKEGGGADSNAVALEDMPDHETSVQISTESLACTQEKKLRRIYNRMLGFVIEDREILNIWGPRRIEGRSIV